MGNFSIKEYEFNENGKSELNKNAQSHDWPVVYLINNDKEMYIGETSSAINRLVQHLQNPERKKLKKINVIFDDEFNKSAILDIEQRLIQLCSADDKFKLQNGNSGQSVKHDYFNRINYVNKVEKIWSILRKKNLADNDYFDLVNSDIFKYSPYNSLTYEQRTVSNSIVNDICESFANDSKGISIVSGTAGTGKTIVLISSIFKLLQYKNVSINYDNYDSEELEELTEELEYVKKIKEIEGKLGRELKIGYVVPMTSIRKTITKVFSSIKNGLKSSMIIGPFDVFKEDYDIVFVDEAHRLTQYKNIGYMGQFSENAKKINKCPKDTTQLEMIASRCKHCILVYDKNQTVKGADITQQQFDNIINKYKHHTYALETQMRCNGGKSYTDYVNEILNCKAASKKSIREYEFKLYSDPNKMIDEIEALDNQFGLCRNAAGYSWKWKSKITKKMKERGITTYHDIIKNNLEDIELPNPEENINTKKYVWNMTNEEFIISPNAVNEIGSIHTMQGYDLNYAGIIFGREIDYDEEKNEIVINKNLFFDAYVKKGSTYQELKKYIINTYFVLLTRGIKGTYVYAYNKGLRNYLRRFIDEV